MLVGCAAMDFLLPESNMSEPFSGPSTMTEPEFVEMSMVLPSWQMDALSQMAESQHISIGQLLRGCITRLVRDRESPMTSTA